MLAFRYLFCLSLLLLCQIAKPAESAELIISEIMPAPKNEEPEWVEIYNASSVPIALDSFYICDKVACKLIPNLTIPPQSYIVLTNDPIFIKNKYGIADSLLFKMILPVLNNTVDDVVIRDKNMQTIDSAYYDMKWGEAGISLERISFEQFAVSKDNWQVCTDTLGGTPGKANSSSEKQCESFFYAEIFHDELRYTLENDCHIDKSYFIRILADFDKSGTYEFGEIVGEYDLELSANQIIHDTIFLSEFFGNFARGRFSVKIDLYSGDDILEEVMLNYQHKISRNDIIFNEIMPEPLPGSSEYIELHNTFNDTINIGGWRIYDASGSFARKSLIIGDVEMPPQSYMTIAADSTFFNQFPYLLNSPTVRVIKSSVTLNNSSDMLVLADQNANIIDSLYYYSNWHNSTIGNKKGISLERISPHGDANSPDNWSSSAAHNGGTPSDINSISLTAAEGTLNIYPNPFNPSARHTDCEIQYKLPFNQARVRVKIFDENAREVAEPANNIFSHSEGVIKFDGKDIRGNFLASGLYIVYLEAISTDSGAVLTKKELLVIK